MPFDEVFASLLLIDVEHAVSNIRKTILRHLQRKSERNFLSPFLCFTLPAPNLAVPMAILEACNNVFELPELEVARHLTIVFHYLYMRMEAEDILMCKAEDYRHQAPTDCTVCRMRLFTSQLVRWIRSNVELDTIRVGRASFFLNIAEHCLKLNNFHTTNALLEGLELTISSGLLPKNVAMQYGQIESDLRAAVAQMNDLSPPLLPLIETLLVETKNLINSEPSDSRIEPPLIDFAKQSKVSYNVRVIQQYQQMPYNLTQVPQAFRLIMSSMSFVSETLVDRTIQFLQRNSEKYPHVQEVLPEDLVERLESLDQTRTFLELFERLLSGQL
eukprot:TRINITY_DN4930_c0_g1_i1.p1 TRINITY_DN4930_c0_g1~~TRINITY_DN4930_c0_g1_i1.p1  ORF type:complete len:330 (-),score=46.94 TRINITY_DN4930_c0_g1_i1:89-1078(-)